MVAIASLLLTCHATSSTCMYCRRADVTAGFLYSYSYCSASNTCLEDQWNYFNQKCSSGWTLGKNVPLSACDPVQTTCNNYISTQYSNGVYTNYTEVLALGQECIITVDATNNLARVIFDNSPTLGVEVSGYLMGTPITVPLGQI